MWHLNAKKFFLSKLLLNVIHTVHAYASQGVRGWEYPGTDGRDPYSALFPGSTTTTLSPQAAHIQLSDLAITVSNHGGVTSGFNPKIWLLRASHGWVARGRACWHFCSGVLPLWKTMEAIVPSAHSLTYHLSLHTELIIINHRPHRSVLNVWVREHRRTNYQ